MDHERHCLELWPGLVLYGIGKSTFLTVNWNVASSLTANMACDEPELESDSKPRLDSESDMRLRIEISRHHVCKNGRHFAMPAWPL